MEPGTPLPHATLPHAYAHHDSEFEPPLERSLAAGFAFIEADVYCLFGRALVAHDLPKLRFSRTLKRLYLGPLRERLRQNGGKVFSDDTSLWLLINIKTDARTSYAAIDRLLSGYQDMLTSFTPEHTYSKPVTVILSGNRLPYDLTAKFPLRHAALDGRISDLGIHTNPNVMPMVSDDWRKHFRWLGAGPMPEAERQKLAEMVGTAHGHGQKLRFWGTPDRDTPERTAVWDMLLTAGVDLIAMGDLAGLKRYLEEKGCSS